MPPLVSCSVKCKHLRRDSQSVPYYWSEGQVAFLRWMISQQVLVLFLFLAQRFWDPSVPAALWRRELRGWADEGPWREGKWKPPPGCCSARRLGSRLRWAKCHARWEEQLKRLRRRPDPLAQGICLSACLKATHLEKGDRWRSSGTPPVINCLWVAGPYLAWGVQRGGWKGLASFIALLCVCFLLVMQLPCPQTFVFHNTEHRLLPRLILCILCVVPGVPVWWCLLHRSRRSAGNSFVSLVVLWNKYCGVPLGMVRKLTHSRLKIEL